MSFGFTPKLESVSSIFFAAEFHEVHSPGVKIEGTSSALMRLKSQLLSKLRIMILRVSALSAFTDLIKSSFCSSHRNITCLIFDICNTDKQPKLNYLLLDI